MEVNNTTTTLPSTTTTLPSATKAGVSPEFPHKANDQLRRIPPKGEANLTEPSRKRSISPSSVSPRLDSSRKKQLNREQQQEILPDLQNYHAIRFPTKIPLESDQPSRVPTGDESKNLLDNPLESGFTKTTPERERQQELNHALLKVISNIHK
jgi:hypothetical protein